MSGVVEVLDVLERAGFERLPRPLSVVGAEFDFEAAACGTSTSHDLVVVASGEIPRRRLLRLLSGLTRSLDLAQSRRPVSLVLLGGVDTSVRAELERLARVLPVASHTPSVAEIEAAVAVLLPLRLPNADLVHGSDPINEVLAVLTPMKVTPDHLFLIRAANGGVEAVKDGLRRYADRGTGWNDANEEKK